MKNKTIDLAILTILVFFLLKLNAQDLVIVNATLIDCTGNKVKPNMTVHITDGIITSIEKFSRKNYGGNIRKIDATGKFLIPGLWDTHAHCINDSMFLPLMLANGVTSVRDMYNNLQHFKMKSEWRELINENKLIGPNLYLPVAVMSSDQLWYKPVTVSNHTEVIKTVNEIKTVGADFIKIFDLYDPEIYYDLIKEAKRAGIPVFGHCPISINIADAAKAGQSSFEHLLGVLLACSSNETEIRKQMVQGADEVKESLSDLTYLLYFVQPAEIINTYDKIKAANLFISLKNSGSYQCPNLVLWAALSRINNSDSVVDERLKYVPPKFLKNWRNFNGNRYTENIKKEDHDVFKKLIDKRFEVIKELNQTGVKFLAGTDVNWANAYIIPGFGLHDELSLLVKSGLSPIQALQSSTKNAAESLGVLERTGTLEMGKCADMVLLDADPLKDIRNTTKINAVIKGGDFYSREMLDNLLYEIEMKAKK